MSQGKISDITEPMCGCIEEEEVSRVYLKALKWASEPMETRASYESLFEDVGVFYIVMNKLEEHGFIDHGTAIRYPWLTQKGKSAIENDAG